MIGYLEGKVKFVRESSAIVLVGGIGYDVFMTQRALRQLQSDVVVQLFTHHHVRENEITLYGFETSDDLELFSICIGVSGIGPKAGLKILDLGEAHEIKQAIAREDFTFLTRVSGLGKKKAQRLVIEAKQKIEDLGLTAMPSHVSSGLSQSDTSTSDALSALLGLGYKEHEVRDVLRELPDSATSAEEKVRAALKLLGQGQRV